ncbi:MAG: hypothetical protein IT423_12405 [Pirellulaceae bacterium]|nr:hypothetical protein [Pirellulaceae bacterium]
MDSDAMIQAGGLDRSTQGWVVFGQPTTKDDVIGVIVRSERTLVDLSDLPCQR